jgi:succinate dehydrogenase / fumarate reductase flavoprotein subunit/L-aspartate oxidase
MGNALLDILSMGRRAGAKAAESRSHVMASRAGIGHVHAWQRELTLAGLPLHVKAPQLFPEYAHFDLRVDAGLRSSTLGVAGGIR